jgi:hypothetical protein
MTSGTTREARITADPDVPLDGPNGTRTRIDRWDCRTGGSYRLSDPAS